MTLSFAIQSVGRSAADAKLDVGAGISLADPWFLLALPLVALAIERGAGARRTAPLVLPSTPPPSEAFRTGWRARLAWLPAALRLLAAVLVVVALARPLLGRIELSSSTEGIDIALILDRSSSMDQPMEVRGRRRIDVVREVVADYAVRRTTDREGAADDVALFAFAGFTDLLVPFTRDANALEEAARAVDVVQEQRLDGTGIGVALARAVEVLQDSPAKSKVAVLLTDGEETVHAIDPIESAELAAEAGVRVHVVYAGPREALRPGFGLTMRVPVDTRTAQEIAQRTGGRFFHAEDRASLEQAYAAIEELERTQREEQRFAERFDLYPRFVAPALALYLLAWLLGCLFFRRIP